METIGEAAARLLQGMEQRAKKTSGESPDPIKKPGASLPGAAEGSADGFGARHPRQQPVGLAGEKATDAGEEPASASALRGEEVARRSLELKADNDNARHAASGIGREIPSAALSRGVLS